MSSRKKTNYPGVYYREAKRTGGKGVEKVYYVVFKREGRTIEEKVGRQFVDDMTPARAARIRGERIEGKRQSRKEIRQEIEIRKEAENSKWTIDRLWNEYKSQKDLKGLAQDASRYRLYIKPVFGDLEPHEIAPLDVDRVRIRMLKRKSPQHVKLTLALLKRIVRFGEKRRLNTPLPFLIELPSVDNIVTEDLDPEQLSALVKAINEDHDIQVANLMRMALFTGMRRSELFRLKWSDIDYNRSQIKIRDPKSGISQSIPLNDATREILDSHPREKSEYVFPGRGGKQRTEARAGLRRIKKRAGLPKDFRPLHGLRHAFASMLASSGKVDLYVLSKLLTHQSPEMTRRYAHLRDEALKRASNVASEAVDQAVKSIMETEEQENLST